MSYAQYLKDILVPIGVYNLEGTFNRAELSALGGALDTTATELETLGQEMNLVTARQWGLDRVMELLEIRPISGCAEDLSNALAALLRISGDSFTVEAINDTVCGCGMNAVVTETGVPGFVNVHFPDVAGEPERFAELKPLIERILPAHVDIEYDFWYITWSMLAERLGHWAEIHTLNVTWDELRKAKF